MLGQEIGVLLAGPVIIDQLVLGGFENAQNERQVSRRDSPRNA
jgi:hypothetical protein